MSLSRQQIQLQSILLQPTQKRQPIAGQTSKLSKSFNPVNQSQSPQHKFNDSKFDMFMDQIKKKGQQYLPTQSSKFITDAKIDALHQARKLVTDSIIKHQISPEKTRESFKSTKVEKCSFLNLSIFHSESSLSPTHYYLDPKLFNNMSLQQLGLTRQQAISNSSIEVIEQFTININHLNQKYTFQIELNHTTDWLESYLIKELKKVSIHQLSSTGSCSNITKTKMNNHGETEQSSSKIVAFISQEKNLPLDFYLTLKGRPLNIFKNQTLNLQPLLFDENGYQDSKITLKDFTFLKCIGAGGFSRVYLVKKKSNGRFYAMKLIDKEFIIKNKKQGIVQNERDIMTVIEHPFIIKLEYSFECRNFVVFVMEFCSGGELFWQLRQVKIMNEDQAKFYFSEICLAMLYLHSLSIVYRDIKPENILIDIDGHIRIADFGLSKPNMGEEDFAYSFCGSPEYMAPEMLLKQGHTVQVDHYCLGALLYELVTGLPPYYSRDTSEIYESILNEELTFPEKIPLSYELKHLLRGLLCKSPSERLGSEGGIAAIMIHPWFKNVNFIALLQKKIIPPFKPNPLKFNFDSNDLIKGELETREKLLGKAGLAQDFRIFKVFYFDKNEQQQIKFDQEKIFNQHFQFILQQQALIDQKYNESQFKRVKTLNSTKKQESAKRSTNSSSRKNSNPKSRVEDQLQKRIEYQQLGIDKFNISRQSNLNQVQQQKNKIIGLKRIISQNNFFFDRQTTLPAGSLSKGDLSSYEFSQLAKKSRKQK